MEYLQSIAGVIGLFGLGYLLSSNKKDINLRTVGGAFLILLLTAGIAFGTSAGTAALGAVSSGVGAVLALGNEGIGFMFGDLAGFSQGFIFAVHVLPTIIFFSALISILYYIGVMGWIVKVLGGFFEKLLGTSKAESMSASANIFVGQTEAPLVVKPFIGKMTKSELFAVMVGGMATIAGGVMAGFAGMGIPLEYLIAASAMAAPAGLMFAKIVMPETEETSTDSVELSNENRPSNIIEAAANGAGDGLKMALNIMAMLIAFVSLIAGVDALLGLINLSFAGVMGYLFAPLAWLTGVSGNDIMTVGALIGTKFTVNEFVAFMSLADVMASLDARTTAIATFALCGFANISSIAILIGGLGAIAPERRGDIAKLGPRALLAATLANLMSATLAGIFLL